MKRFFQILTVVIALFSIVQTVTAYAGDHEKSADHESPNI